jgi:Tol biopolymer transport system component
VPADSRHEPRPTGVTSLRPTRTSASGSRARRACVAVATLALAVPIVVQARQFNDYRTLLVSDPGGSQRARGSQDSSNPSISLDGNYVAYVSGSPRAPGEVYLRDVSRGRIDLISRSSGGAAANGESSEPAVSGSGWNVAFTSKAGNLGGRGGESNVYLRLSRKGETILVSRASGKNGAKGNGESFSPSISSDGEKIVFASTATNLAPGAPPGATNVYLRDLRTNTTTLISRSGRSGPVADGDSTHPQISAGGDAVVFESTAANLSPLANGEPQVYERKLADGNTFIVSVSEDGRAANRAATDPSVDGDGGRVAFASAATNLSDVANPVDNVYVRDLGSGQLLLASRSGGGSKAVANGDSARPDIPRDGRFVCFESVATDLGNPYDGFGVDTRVSNVYVHDLLHHGTFLISRQTGRYSPGGNGNSSNVSCSAGASLAAFQSTSSNLSGGAGPEATSVYRRTIFGGR